MDSHKEKLLKEAFDAYIALMLYDFPLERINEIIADNVTGYGTTVDERVLEIDRLKKIVIDQRELGAGLEMHINTIPVHRRISPDEDSAIFMDEFEITMVIDGANNMIPLRLTSVFEYSDEHWKLVHLHGSKAVETEGDTWHLDEWKKKNDELQKLVDEKTADLVRKNHDLEIEASLERVRTVAMSMNKPDDLLDVCQIISEQLEILNVSDIRNVQVAIIDKPKKLYSNYQFFTPYSKKVFEETAYENNPASQAMVTEMQKSVNSFFIGSIKDDDLQEFRKWRKKYKQVPDPLLDKSSAVYYYFYSIGKGGLGLTTYQEISSVSLEIFKRFHKVFALAYSRFIDIQQAEARAYEARIETALERVRAIAMAMHKPEDLSAIGKTIFSDLKLLGFESIRNTEIVINNDDKESVISYHYSDYGKEEIIEIGYKDNPIVMKWAEDLKKAEDAFVPVSIPEKEMQSWDEYRLSLGYQSDPKMASAKDVHYYSYSIGLGALSISTWLTLSDDQINVLGRFRNVFKLSYQRYKDIEQADAQAREAQIELALERVRARTMAMQKSDELEEVIQVIFDQLGLLDINAEHAGIVVDYQPEKDWHFWIAETQDIPSKVTVPYLDLVWDRQFTETKKKGKDFFTTQLDFDEKNSFYEELLPHIQGLTKKAKNFYLNCTGLAISTVIQKDIGLYIENFSGIPYTDAENSILMRFGKVFQQTYTRFNDLKQAEAQAREAMIEASLERVRARSMAMHTSDEMMEVIQIIFQELSKLGIDVMECSIVTYDTNPKDLVYWSSGSYATDEPSRVKFQYFDHPILVDLFKDLEDGVRYRSKEFSGELLRSWWDRVFAETDFKNIPKEIIKSWKEIKQVFYAQATMNHGFLEFVGETPLSEDKVQIIKRFTKVVDLTYTRFDDVKRAEAQAREAQIEAALERVRSKTMAMHNSDDMANTVVTLFEEVLKLGLDNDIRCGIGILEGSERMETRSATLHPKGGVDLKIGMLDMTIHPLLKRIKNGWERGETHYVDQMSGKDVVKYYTALNNEPDYPFLRDLNTLPKIEYHNSFSFPEGILFAFSPNPMSDEAAKVLDRFANVFGQTYRRFRDLQKAEEQARESQIEAALERVRSKAMAMHSSEDLGFTVDTFFSELKSLNVAPHRCGLGIIDKETKIVNIQAIDTNGSKSIKKVVGNLKLSGHPVLDKIFENWELQKEYFPVLKGKEIMEYYNVMNPQVKFHEFADDEVQYGYYFYFKEGGVYAWTDSELPERDLQIFRRYSSVLSLTYRRYLDLKEAEAQAREARIEAALEKVRGQSMAMHKSEQLPETAKVLFEQFKSLGKIPDRIGIVLIKEEVKEVELWATDQIGSQLKDRFRGSLGGASSMVKMHKAWKEGKESIVIDLTGTELKDWMRYTREEMKLVVDDKNMKGRRVQQAAFFSHGFLIFTSNEPVADEIMKLLVRFAKVFDQAYIRFLDLQNAEAQAKEAIKQASLDRVRGQIASMRSTNDLQRITPLIWSELETLGVPFIRCGVFIIDETMENIQVFLTTPDGKAIGALNLPLDANNIIFNIVDYWKKKKVFTQHWNKEDFVNWMQSMIKLGQVKSEKEYQGNVAPPESLDLNFIPFTQGMLYVGNNKPLSEDKIDLVKSLAKAFSVAYARYEDFKQLEDAKNKIENTFNDLKATQNQLVHAEKMASLGELTAGIAHEIQNPLNFVNNFSEVSVDLMEEMAEEMTLGNTEEVKDIANDLKQNLEKIHHHGKRASYIVQGMLEHSRTNPGDKKPTNINVLADEFLRLSYHGLRAKDKSFNAEIITDFDKDLPDINVIAQDFGRVLLNLVNNAFYAVAEKQKRQTEGYKPSVLVSTKKIGDKVEVRIKDNGNGIPDEVIKKIFQPFFTTKPTGEGTGLGLSMSYDIITKGHGGKLEVETKEGEGTSFIIIIPFKS